MPVVVSGEMIRPPSSLAPSKRKDHSKVHQKSSAIIQATGTVITRTFTVDEKTGQITMTTPSKLTDDERNKVNQLRELMGDELTAYYNTDFNLLRWLKGHNNNFDEIVPKLRNHLTFRKSHWDLDTLADKARDHPIHAFWRPGLTGDSGKVPNAIVNIEQTGTNDYWGILQTFPLNEVMKARVYDLETFLRAVMDKERKTGEQTSIMYVMDLNGLTFDKRLMTLMTGALSSISTFMSEHYVELIHSFVLVNAPNFISTIWKMASPLLPERTRAKVKIFGSQWRTEIQGIADVEVLPAYWNAPGGDELFKANVLRSVPLPTSGYYKGGMLDERAKTLSVGASKVGFVDRIGNEGQKLKWTFEADGHFAYGVYFTKDPAEIDINKMKCVYPKFIKVPGPTFVPLRDELVLPATGTYKFWFSNEHAWIHTLKVRHHITVETL